MSSKNKDTRTRILEVTWHLMEQQRGQGVRLADVAAAAGVSRQAVYLHFGSRTELMIATTAYVDEVKGLNDRLQQ
ncbi:helix-turn-helix transcriptional regulator, partial [candidate division KSB1 bacterium]|nr:helix-turn-helix transcriptional regulator [candidate division KSB1 bacterium]